MSDQGERKVTIRRRKPIRWPDGARIAITPCIIFETWPEDLGGPNSRQNEIRAPFPRKAVTKKNLGTITDREFGERVGIFRLLDIFNRAGIKTTFFFTGVTAVNHPDVCKEIIGQGHEIGTETWIHDYSFMKTKAREKKDLETTVKAILKVIGSSPKGYISTGVAPSAYTAEIILDLGYTYWVDLQHEETPYTLKLKRGELIVLPYYQYLNDYATYRASERNPREQLQIWKDTFDCLYEEGGSDPKAMIWGNHPFLSGRPYRAKILEEFFSYAKGHSRVWFARAGDISDWYRQNYGDAHVEEWPNFMIGGRRGRESDLLSPR